MLRKYVLDFGISSMMAATMETTAKANESTPTPTYPPDSEGSWSSFIWSGAPRPKQLQQSPCIISTTTAVIRAQFLPRPMNRDRMGGNAASGMEKMR